jgi:hypothetical protein
MSAVVPATCSRCPGILLHDEDFYVLQNLDYMTSSECPGCGFFLRVAKRYNIDVTDGSQTQILLRRCSKDGDLVYVYYLRRQGVKLAVTGLHQLRLCATFEMCLNQYRV